MLFLIAILPQAVHAVSSSTNPECSGCVSFGGAPAYYTGCAGWLGYPTQWPITQSFYCDPNAPGDAGYQCRQYNQCMANGALKCGSGGSCSDGGVQGQTNGGSPIMVNLAAPQDQRDFGLTCVAGGNHFDVDIDGVAEPTAWPAADSTAAFLVHPNADGSVVSGANLFGDQERWANGYDKLAAVFDSNGDGEISAADARVRELKWWTDGQGGAWDGVAQPQELWPFLEVTSSLRLRNRETGFTDGCNELRWLSRATLADTPLIMNRYPGNGRKVLTSDVILRSAD